MTESGVSAREMYELKQKAMEYYAENGVPQKMEEILNSMFYDQPNDVFGHITNYFQEFVKTPTITKLKAREVLDSKGQPTLQTEVYCTVRNNEKLIVSSVASSENFQPEHATQEEKDEEEAERQKAVVRALELIRGDLTAALLGHDPTQQHDGDVKIFNVFERLRQEEEERLAKEKAENPEAEVEGSSRPVSVASAKKGTKSPKGGKGGKGGPAVVIIPDEPREKLLCGCSAVSAISRTLCEAGSQLAEKPLYCHVASLKYGQAPEKYVMPLPMVTILTGGRAFPGKNNCIKDYMVVPKPGMAIAESIKMINNIYTSVTKALTAKTGVAARCVSDTGGLCPTLDKPENGLDLLQEAVTSLGLTAGEDVFFALNCGLHETFDHEKGKYEVMAGAVKTPDDLVEFWADLQTRYPAVIALIDPMRKQEKEAWMKLCERVSEQCLVVGDTALHRPGLLKDEDLPEDFKTSGVVVRLEQITSVSDVLQVTKKMEEADNAVIISASQGDSPDAFVVDLAVGAGARFAKLGAPSRGERVAKLNRLIQIEADLEVKGQLGPQASLTFPRLELPPPPEEEGEEGEGKASPTKSESPTKKK